MKGNNEFPSEEFFLQPTWHPIRRLSNAFADGAFHTQLCSPRTHILTTNPCNISAELQMQRHWILKLTKLDIPSLRSFSINVHFDVRTNSFGCANVLVEYQRILTLLDKLASLRVYVSNMYRDWEDETSYTFDIERIVTMNFDSGMNEVDFGVELGGFTRRSL
jgi:hypothetical protein